MDEERIQTHGIAAGGVVYHLIPGLHGRTVLDFKKTVILHTGKAGDPLAFYYGPFFRLIHINHMVGINMSGDKRVQVCTAAVSDEEGMITDFLHIFYGGDECRSPGDQGYAGFSDQRGTCGIEFSAQLLTDGIKIIPIIRLVLPPPEITASHIHIGKLQIIFLRYPYGHTGQRGIDGYSAGLGGGMQVQTGDFDIGEPVYAGNNFLQPSVFITVAKAAAFFLHQYLLWTKGGDITVYTYANRKITLRVSCA